MIRRPSYKEYLGKNSNFQSSINLSFNDSHSARLRSRDISPNYIDSKSQLDPNSHTSFLDIIKNTSNGSRTLRHTYNSQAYSNSNLDLSFNSTYTTISPKKLDSSLPPKPTRPMSSFRPNSTQQTKKPLLGFATDMNIENRVEESCQCIKPKGRSFFQSQQSKKMTSKLLDEPINFRNKRSQNSNQAAYHFEDQFRIQLQRIPRTTVNLNHTYNKQNRTNQGSSHTNRSFNKEKTSLKPILLQADPSIFAPIQFRKKNSNHACVDNKISTDFISIYPNKRQQVVLSTISRPEQNLFSTFHINELAKQQRHKQKKVQLSDFILGKKLGEGRFGSVWMVIHKATGSIFAMKKISKALIRQNMMIQQFILQVKIQLFIENSYVVRLFGIFDDEESIYLILEYLQGGTLYSQLKRKSKGKMSEQEASAQIGMLCQAVNCLHLKGIAHRDIKPQNIITTGDVCKLGDFGWATLCDQRRKTYCGTTDYVAPEIVQGLQYDFSVDLWCVGVLTYELLAGRAPFYHISRQQTFNIIKNVDSSTLTYPQYFSSEAIDFIGKLIKKNPKERMEMSEALEHSFITKNHL